MIEYGWPVPCAHGNLCPQLRPDGDMGRSAAAYDALRTYTETIVTVLNDAKTAGNGLNTALKK
jgi:hypothetical protein